MRCQHLTTEVVVIIPVIMVVVVLLEVEVIILIVSHMGLRSRSPTCSDCGRVLSLREQLVSVGWHVVFELLLLPVVLLFLLLLWLL